MKTMGDFRFDADAIFERYGGVFQVQQMLKEAGIKVNVKTLQKQKERGVIPAHALASICYAASKAGLPMDFSDFLLTREKGE